MIVHLRLHALRGKDAPQRDAHQALYEAMIAWKGLPDYQRIATEIADFGKGQPIAQCPALTELFAPDNTAAADFVGAFTRISTQALRDAPLAHVPLRHFTDGFNSTLLLARSGPVTLSLVALDGHELAARPAPINISFGPNETWEIILSGRAIAELFTCQPTGPRSSNLTRSDVPLRAGCTMMRDNRHKARILREIEGTLVSCGFSVAGTMAGRSVNTASQTARWFTRQPEIRATAGLK